MHVDDFMGGAIDNRSRLGDDRRSDGAERINNIFEFRRVCLIILHVEFRLPVLPRAFFQDVRY
jgi:uncharacterized protein YgfB (UPF0149 family)